MSFDAVPLTGQIAISFSDGGRSSAFFAEDGPLSLPFLKPWDLSRFILRDECHRYKKPSAKHFPFFVTLRCVYSGSVVEILNQVQDDRRKEVQ